MALHSLTHKCVCLCMFSVHMNVNTVTNILLIKIKFFLLQIVMDKLQQLKVKLNYSEDNVPLFNTE